MNKSVEAEEVKQPHIAFNYIAILLVLTGLGLFYGLQLNVWLKWGIFILSLAAGAGTFFFLSPMGINLHGYFRDSYRELQKVVWPARDETIKFTFAVFVFVIILGLFLWAVDGSLAWLLYDVILGKGS